MSKSGSSIVPERGKGASLGSIEDRSKTRRHCPLSRDNPLALRLTKLSSHHTSVRNNAISCKFFPSTLRGVAMQWFVGLLPKTIHTFNDLAVVFVSQFATNRAKRLEVTNLFCANALGREAMAGVKEIEAPLFFKAVSSRHV
ncbi:hypothetical protein CR513_07244, partial [Mucuna pruriens]